MALAGVSFLRFVDLSDLLIQSDAKLTPIATCSLLLSEVEEVCFFNIYFSFAVSNNVFLSCQRLCFLWFWGTQSSSAQFDSRSLLLMITKLSMQ